MELSRKGRRGCALALAAVLTLPGLSLMKTQAAVGIETGRDDCSLTVSVGVGGSDSEYLEDFNRMSIPVSVYQVANVDVTGRKYTPVGAFTDMGLLPITMLWRMSGRNWREKLPGFWNRYRPRLSRPEQRRWRMRPVQGTHREGSKI